MIKRIIFWLIEKQRYKDARIFKDLITKFLPEYHLRHNPKKRKQKEGT